MYEFIPFRTKLGGVHTFDVWIHTFSPKKYELTHWKVWIHTFWGKCMNSHFSMCEFILFGGKVWIHTFWGKSMNSHIKSMNPHLKKYEFTHKKYEPPVNDWASIPRRSMNRIRRKYEFIPFPDKSMNQHVTMYDSIPFFTKSMNLLRKSMIFILHFCRNNIYYAMETHTDVAIGHEWPPRRRWHRAEY